MYLFLGNAICHEDPKLKASRSQSLWKHFFQCLLMESPNFIRLYGLFLDYSAAKFKNAFRNLGKLGVLHILLAFPPSQKTHTKAMRGL